MEKKQPFFDIKIPSLPSSGDIENDNFLVIEQKTGTKKVKVGKFSSYIENYLIESGFSPTGGVGGEGSVGPTGPTGDTGSIDVKDISYVNSSAPGVFNVSSALDYLFANGTGGIDIGSLIDNYAYWGIAETEEVTKEVIINKFYKADILNPDPNATDIVKQKYPYSEVTFGEEKFPKDQYLYFISPYIYGEPTAKDLSNGFEGGFDLASTDIKFKAISLPNSKGLVQEYYLKRTDYPQSVGGNWLFYFKNSQNI